MEKYESTLIKKWYTGPQDREKPSNQAKTELIQAKVSPATRDEIRYFVDEGDYSSVSQFIRDSLQSELEGGEIQLRKETLEQARQIQRIGDFPTVEVVLHEAVKRLYDEAVEE